MCCEYYRSPSSQEASSPDRQEPTSARFCLSSLVRAEVVSLAEARNVAFANRQRARTGGDPLAEKRHGQGVPTVEEAAAVVLEQQRPGWRNAKHARDWPRSLRAYAFPRIGALPVSAGRSTSSPRCRRSAVGRGPAPPSRPSRPAPSRRSIVPGLLEPGQLGALSRCSAPSVASGSRQFEKFLVTVKRVPRVVPIAMHDSVGHTAVSQASFEFLVLTAARSGEVRLATCDEIDLDAGVWTIPAARMKAKRDHRVPLSRRALAILHDVQRLSDGTSLAFRSLRG